MFQSFGGVATFPGVRKGNMRDHPRSEASNPSFLFSLSNSHSPFYPLLHSLPPSSPSPHATKSVDREWRAADDDGLPPPLPIAPERRVERCLWGRLLVH
jgi:hypothetical protein